VAGMLNIPNIEKEIEILYRFLQIIDLLAKEGPMGFRKLSEKLNLPPHLIKHALMILQLDFIIRTSGKGSMLTNTALREMKAIKEDLEILREELDELITYTDKIIKEIEAKQQKAQDTK
jgi:predicted transcriptional regulator